MDIPDFRRRTPWSDYQRHKYWFVGFALGFVGVFAFDTPYFFVLSGLSLIASGVSAIRAKKSAVTDIAFTSSGGSTGMEWSSRQLEAMAPHERASHAYLTGSFLILMGTGFLAGTAFYGWIQFRKYQAAKSYAAMAEAAGLVSQAASAGVGLAADARQVCWGGHQAMTFCKDPGFLGGLSMRGDFFQALELVYTPRGLVLAGHREVNLLARVDGKAIISHSWRRLFVGRAKGLTALGNRVAWVHDADVVVADLASERPLQSPQVVAHVANAENPLLALSTDSVFYGPTEACALERHGSQGCVVPRERSPCAVASSPKQLVLVTSSGELWRADPESGAMFTRVASGLSGCLLAVNDRFAFVAGMGPIARVELGTGSNAIIFRDVPASALALSDRMLYFRTASEIHGIRLDAPAL